MINKQEQENLKQVKARQFIPQVNYMYCSECGKPLFLNRSGIIAILKAVFRGQRIYLINKPTPKTPQ